MGTYSASPRTDDFCKNESPRLKAFPITDTAVDRELSTFEDEPPLDYVQPLPLPNDFSAAVSHSQKSSTPIVASAVPGNTIPTVRYSYERGLADVSVESAGFPNAPPPTPQVAANHVAKGNAYASRGEGEAAMRGAVKKEGTDLHKLREQLKVIDLTLEAIEMRMQNDRVLSGLLFKLGRDAAEATLTTFCVQRSEERRGPLTGRSAVEEKLDQEVRRLQHSVNENRNSGKELMAGHEPDLVQRMEDVEMESSRLRKKELETVEAELQLVEHELAKSGDKVLRQQLDFSRVWCVRVKNQHIEEQKRKGLKQGESHHRGDLGNADVIAVVSRGLDGMNQDAQHFYGPPHVGHEAQALPGQLQPAASTYMFDPSGRISSPSVASTAMGNVGTHPSPVPSQQMYMGMPNTNLMQQAPEHVDAEQYPAAVGGAAIRFSKQSFLVDAIHAATMQGQILAAQPNQRYGFMAPGSTPLNAQYLAASEPNPYQAAPRPVSARPEYGAQPPGSTLWPYNQVNPSQPPTHMHAQHTAAHSQPTYFPQPGTMPMFHNAAPHIHGQAYGPPLEYSIGRPHSLSHNPMTLTAYQGGNQIGHHGQMPGYGPAGYPNALLPPQNHYQQRPGRPQFYPEGTYQDNEVLPYGHPNHNQQPPTTAPPLQPIKLNVDPRLGHHAGPVGPSAGLQTHGPPYMYPETVPQGTRPLESTAGNQTAGEYKFSSHMYMTNRGPSSLFEAENEYYLLQLKKFANGAQQGAGQYAAGQAAFTPAGMQNVVPRSCAQPAQLGNSLPIPQSELARYPHLQGKHLRMYSQEVMQKHENGGTQASAQLTAEMMQQNTQSYEEYVAKLREAANGSVQPTGIGRGNGVAQRAVTGQVTRAANMTTITGSDIITGAIPVESIPLFPDVAGFQNNAGKAHASDAQNGRGVVSGAINQAQEQGRRVVMVPQLLPGATQAATHAGEINDVDRRTQALQSMINAFANM